MYDFNGSSTYLEYYSIGNGQDVDVNPNAAFTLSFWVMVDTYVQYRRLLHLNTASGGFMCVFSTNSNTLGMCSGDGTSGWGEPTGFPLKYGSVSNGSLYHIWYTRSASSPAFRYWLNNTEITATDGTTGYNGGTSNSRLNLGRRSDAAQYGDCKLGEITMWNAEINTDTEREFVYRGGNPTKVRGDAIRFYLPLRTDLNPIRYPATSTGPTITNGSPTLSTTHPNVMLPGAPIRLRRTAAAGGTPQTINLGLASETDSALAMTRSKARTLGMATETDLALAVSIAKSLGLGMASETDTALAMTAHRLYDLGLAEETGTAFSIAIAKSLGLGLATETDTALAMAAARLYALGLATETDTAMPLTHAKTVHLGLATEIDTAMAITTSAEAETTPKRPGPMVRVGGMMN